MKGIKDNMNPKKQQYSSRIMVQPNNSTSKIGGLKIFYKRDANSDVYRDFQNEKANIPSDNEVLNVNSLITQAPKGGRPSTSSNNYMSNQVTNNAGNVK